MMISVERIPQDRFGEIATFYSKVGYGKMPQATDSVLGAFDQERLVGAARLSEEHDILVLRGMYVEEESQSQGIGRQLLAAAGDAIGSRECWCVPYAHLEGFYSQIGFQECAPELAPGFLQERVSRYRDSGRLVMIMRRGTHGT